MWCADLSIPVPLSKEDELPLQEQYLERELVPSWLEEQSCLPSPGRTGIHCSRVTWGLRVRAVSFPCSFNTGLTRGKSMSVCVVVSFLPLLLLPDQYLSGISLVAKIPSACWNKECIYLHGLAW